MPGPSLKRRNPTHRAERVGELVRHALAEVLMRGDVLDVGPVTIPTVRMSPDLKMATVTVMPLGGVREEATIEALTRSQRALRTLVAQRINLKFAPELRFSLDLTFDAQGRIDALLQSPPVARDLARDPADGHGPS